MCILQMNRKDEILQDKETQLAQLQQELRQSREMVSDDTV